jgi:hypothetical protein
MCMLDKRSTLILWRITWNAANTRLKFVYNTAKKALKFWLKLIK